MKKNWKIILAVTGFIAYIALLIYISSTQSDYHVKLSTESESYVFTANEQKEYVIPVTVDNKANRVLSSSDEYKIYLAYHLYDAQGNLLNYDGMRSSFPHQLLSHNKATVEMRMNLEPGEYIVEIDVIQEFVTWFAEHEDTSIRIKVKVE